MSDEPTTKPTIETLLETLSAEERMILTLWAEGAGLRAIAEKTRIPPSTIARTLKRAQKKVVKGLFEEVDEIIERLGQDRQEIDRLREETRSNISVLQRMVAACAG